MHRLFNLDRALGQAGVAHLPRGSSQPTAGPSAEQRQPADEAGQALTARDAPGSRPPAPAASGAAAAAGASTAAQPQPQAAGLVAAPRKQPRRVPKLLHRPRLPASRFLAQDLGSKFNPKLGDNGERELFAPPNPGSPSPPPAAPGSPCLLLGLLPGDLLAVVASRLEHACDRVSLAATCHTLWSCCAAHSAAWWGGPVLRLEHGRAQRVAQLSVALQKLRPAAHCLVAACPFAGGLDRASRQRLSAGVGSQGQGATKLAAGLRLPSPPLAGLRDLRLYTQRLGAAELAAILAHTQLTRLWLWQTGLSASSLEAALDKLGHPLAQALFPPPPAVAAVGGPQAAQQPAPPPAAERAQVPAPSNEAAALPQLASLFLGHNRNAPTDSLLAAMAAPSSLTYLGLPGGAASPSLPAHLSCFTRLAALNLASNGRYERLFGQPAAQPVANAAAAGGQHNNERGMEEQEAADRLPPPIGLERLASLAPTLTFLDLSCCSLQALPECLSSLTNLQVLELRNSGGTRDGWQHLPASLLSLGCADGTLPRGGAGEQAVPEPLTRLTALQQLVANNHKRLSGGRELLGCLPHLAHLDLSSCGLPAVPEALTALSPVLTHLDLSRNDLHRTDNLARVLGSLPRLRFLSLELSGGMLGPDLGRGLALSCTQLTYLNVEPLRRLVMGPRLSPWGTPWKQLLEAVALRCAASPRAAAGEAPEGQPLERSPEQPPGLADLL